MRQTNSGVMEHLDWMEQIDSDIMDQVLKWAGQFDVSEVTRRQVLAALEREHLNLKDYALLLSPAAGECLEELAARAKAETASHFGNAVCLFTPLYIANYCENHCVYCGFNCQNKIHRGRLEPDEVAQELDAIAATGLREILLLTGESRHMSDVSYIGEAVKLAAERFSTVGIEIYPLNTEEYAYLHRCGADFVSVYQETYDPVRYEQMHRSGPKRVFPYRLNAQERALRGGMRGVAFGALLGLSDFRRDAFATGVHAWLLQRKYPHAEISFSVPRLRPYINREDNNPGGVREAQLLQVMLAYRLLMPFAGITISTRERAGFRDHIVGLAATKISAGVKVGVGGHEEEQKGDEQFEISDPRSVEAVRDMLLARGLQPVYTDYVRV